MTSNSDTKKLTLPNVISLTRIPLAIVVFIEAAITGVWAIATPVLLFAVYTDVLDGYLARKFPAMESKLGRDVLEPVCDMTLSTLAVAGLIVGGVWPWQAGAALLVVAGGLQLISQFADANDVMRRLKRHQFYIHPLLFIVTMLVACISYIWMATKHDTTLCYVVTAGFGLAVGLTIYNKRGRLAYLFAGPQPIE